jgi:hypothetical protein
LTAAFAVGLAFLGDARPRGAFFAAFFLIALVFLTVVVFLRVAAFVTGVFWRFLAFGFLSCCHHNLPGRSLDDAQWNLKPE